MYTMEELKAAAERLAAAGTPYLGKTLYVGEGHKIVVRPYFDGRLDRGLFYLLNVDDSPYSDMYILSNMETGASEDLQRYIDKILPNEIAHWVGQRETREREAQEAAAEAERVRFHGFTDSMTDMQKGRVVKTLDKRYRFDEGVMTRAERVEMMAATGGYLSTWTNPRGNTEYRIHDQKGWFYIVTKTEYEYFQYLKSR